MRVCKRGVRAWAWVLWAFAGVVVPAGVGVTAPTVELVHVVTAQFPVYVTHAEDGRIFIVELAGRVLVCDAASCTTPTTFLDLTGVVDTSDDGGLLTIAFHPQHSSNGYFFVSYTETGTGPSTRSVIARYQVSAGDPDVADAGSEARLIELEQPLQGHTNGQLAFGPLDGFLYVGFGDGGGHGGPDCRAQHASDALGTGAFFGKILRLDVDQNTGAPPYYGIPAGNPFESLIDGVQDEIWALGLRNPWRFSFDPLDGDLWIGDVGESAREEVNRQLASSTGGENYGWKVMEGTSCHDPDPVDATCPVGTPSCFDSSYTAPLHEYVNTGWATDFCSVTGGYVYRGSAIPGLHGAYVFGDFCGGFVWALEETSPDVWARSELARLDMGLTSFGEDAAGEIYVTHDDDVYRLAFVSEVPALGLPGVLVLAAALGLWGGRKRATGSRSWRTRCVAVRRCGR